MVALFRESDNSFGADMYVGHAVDGDFSELFAVDHRVQGFRGPFKTIEEMAKYVASEFGAEYTKHITYKPPIPPYDVLNPKQIEDFVLAMQKYTKK